MQKILKKMLDFWSTIMYNILTVKIDKLYEQSARAERRMNMDEMNTSELLVQQTEQKTKLEILLLLEQCKDLEEAKEKIKALLNK